MVRYNDFSYIFYLYLREYNNQDASGTYIHTINLYPTLMDKYIVKGN